MSATKEWHGGGWLATGCWGILRESAASSIMPAHHRVGAVHRSTAHRDRVARKFSLPSVWFEVGRQKTEASAVGNK